VPERRRSVSRSNGRAAGVGGALAALVRWLWSAVARRPVDACAIVLAVAASLVVVVNAVFLQTGPHPAPFFANPAASQPAPNDRRADITAASAPAPRLPERLPDQPTRTAAVGARNPQAAGAHRADPIGDLIGSSVSSPTRVVAVQRALSEFGYGQIKSTGVLDEPTAAAIAKFESEHKMPVTGRVSDRLLAELAAMTSRTID
jgi:hypothetical protein